MTKTLYLMLGYPGAGKTTAAKTINEITGAVHLWADKIRNEHFDNPTHSHEENLKLYDYLNELAAELLATGQSVVFDAAFNFYEDRQRLQEIASSHDADTKVVWVKTAKELSKDRATHEDHSKNNTYPEPMKPERFKELSDKLEPPRPDEKVIELDGTKITPDYVKSKLGD